MIATVWVAAQQVELRQAVYAFSLLRYSLLTLLVVGCGGGNKSVCVSGDVSYAGESIEQGRITFRPIRGTKGPITGGKIIAGRYELIGDTKLRGGGTYGVEITGIAPSKQNIKDVVVPNGEPVPVMQNYIPPNYNTKSTLEWSIAKDATHVQRDYHLEVR